MYITYINSCNFRYSIDWLRIPKSVCWYDKMYLCIIIIFLNLYFIGIQTLLHFHCIHTIDTIIFIILIFNGFSQAI